MKTIKHDVRSALLSFMALVFLTTLSYAGPLLFTLEGTSRLGESVSIQFAVDEQAGPDEILSGQVYVYRVVGDVVMQGFHPMLDMLYTNANLELRLTETEVYLTWRDYWQHLRFLRMAFTRPIFTEFTPWELCETSGLVETEIFLGQDHGSGYITEEVSTIILHCEGVPCAPCDGKVTELTLRYNGVEPGIVTVTDKKNLVLDEVAMNPGQSFTLLGHDKNGTLGTTIHLYINGVKDGSIHTSCSKPMGPGMTFGSFTVTGGYSRNGGRLCPEENDESCACEGKVTTLTLEYMGPPAEVRIDTKKKKKGKKHVAPIDPLWEGVAFPGDLITVVGNDKKGTLGTEITLYVDEVAQATIHTSCSKPVGPGLLAGDFLVVEGRSLKGGGLCPVEDDPEEPEDCACDGKLTELMLRYEGGEGAQIRVMQKKEGVIYDAYVDKNGLVLLLGIDKKGTLGAEITVYVNDQKDTAIHTSCSKPIDVGLRVGSFTVVDGYSLKGGRLCGTEDKPSGGGG